MPGSSYAVGPHWRLVFQDMGLDCTRVLHRAGLPDDLLSGGAFRISKAEYSALWQAAASEKTLEPIAVAFARALSVEAFGAYVFAAVCCADLNQASERLAQYRPIVGPTRVAVRRESDGTRLTMSWPHGMVVPEALAFVELLFWVALVRLTTRSNIVPVEVSGPGVLSDAQAYRAYLGVSVTHADTWSIRFSPADAGRPFLTANEPMWQFFEPELRKGCAALEGPQTMVQRVRSVLVTLLPTGDASMESVCDQLAIGKRTLQRRLTDEGTAFQAVLAETRSSLAQHYLCHTDLPAASISFLLGYDDPNSFYRAFVTWTGLTADAFRTGKLPTHAHPGHAQAPTLLELADETRMTRN